MTHPLQTLALAALALSLTISAAAAQHRFGNGPGTGPGFGPGFGNAPVIRPEPEPEQTAFFGRNGIGGRWQVSGVGRHDGLNVRLGPGTEYPVVETLGPRTGGLSLQVCTPTWRLVRWAHLTPHQMRQLSGLPTWCLIEERGRMLGWVNARYLARD